jgi:hypothetical protein
MGRFGVQALKSGLGVIGALVPVLYFGGLLYYFIDVGGSVQGAEAIGLGPTLLGLGIVGLLFCIPLIIKIVRIFASPHSPGSGGGPDASMRDDENGFDPDAAIARYMAQRSTEAAPNAPSARPARGGPVRPSGFGRKIR